MHLYNIAASSGERINELVTWVKSHVSPEASTHFSPGGLVPEIQLSPYFGTQSIMMVSVTFIIILLYGVLFKKGIIPRGKLTNFLEVFVVFVRDEISIKNLGQKDGNKWAPFFISLFLFVLGCNLIGLIPGNSTATGSFYVTASLALITFLCMTVGTLVKFGVGGFFKAFMPEGVPGWILILLTPLEMFGLLVKCAALMIRLFANMLAGHIVLYAMIGLMYAFGYIAAPAFIISVGVYALEIFVGFLQAYLFAFLSAMFIGEMFHHAHSHDDEQEHAH
jgi:F-type H+-transporting ATPase subunit a